jgi:hypothetical protein
MLYQKSKQTQAAPIDLSFDFDQGTAGFGPPITENHSPESKRTNLSKLSQIILGEDPYDK